MEPILSAYDFYFNDHHDSTPVQPVWDEDRTVKNDVLEDWLREGDEGQKYYKTLREDYMTHRKRTRKADKHAHAVVTRILGNMELAILRHRYQPSGISKRWDDDYDEYWLITSHQDLEFHDDIRCMERTAPEEKFESHMRFKHGWPEQHEDEEKEIGGADSTNIQTCILAHSGS